MDPISMIAAVTAGNILTILFGWGMWHASKMHADAVPPPGVWIAILLPFAFIVGGLYLSSIEQTDSLARGGGVVFERLLVSGGVVEVAPGGPVHTGADTPQHGN